MSNYIAAIDLGTTKVVTIIGEKAESGRFKILAYEEAPSTGVRRGQVENIQQVILAVTPTLEKVCKKAGIEQITDVYVGIAGLHIRSIENRADCTRENYEVEISEEEIIALENNMYKIRMEPGEEVIHVIPQHYSVDDAIGVTDPVGRLGQRLSANFHIIIGKTTATKHTEICIERMGLKLEKLILEPLASARAVLTEDEKEAGVVMVDMGGGTTDLVVYYDNIVRHTAVIPFGGNIITEDIRKGCKILARYAEQIKVQYGSCLASMVPENKIVSIKGISGREPREIAFKSLANIIEARLEEIINMVMYEISRSGFADKLSTGIVFTGGGSQMKHLAEFIKLKTGMDVRIGKARYVTSNSDKDILHPRLSTAVGLVMCGFDIREGRDNGCVIESKINNTVINKEEETIEEEQGKLQNSIQAPVGKKKLLDRVRDFFEESKKDEV